MLTVLNLWKCIFNGDVFPAEELCWWKETRKGGGCELGLAENQRRRTGLGRRSRWHPLSVDIFQTVISIPFTPSGDWVIVEKDLFKRFSHFSTLFSSLLPPSLSFLSFIISFPWPWSDHFLLSCRSPSAHLSFFFLFSFAVAFHPSDVRQMARHLWLAGRDNTHQPWLAALSFGWCKLTLKV